VITLTLAVPQPSLTQGGQAATRLVAEKTIDLLCGPVLLPDGTTTISSDLKNRTTATYLLQQRDALGTVTSWDDGLKQWVAGVPSKLQTLYPLPAKPTAQPPQPPGFWAATLMAIGQQDAAGHDKFGSDTATGLPVYFVECSFTTTDALHNSYSGTSIASQPVAILPPGSGTSASVEVQPLPPAQAQKIRVFLKDPSGGPDLTMTLHLQPPFASVVAAGASISIELGGDILLAPATGRKLLIQAGGGVWVNGQQVLVP
jgi:hypothetical protein